MSTEPSSLPSGRTTRDWTVDGVFVLSAAVIGVMAWNQVLDGQSNRVLIGFDLIGGIAGWLALWWRRRWPILICIVVPAAVLLPTLWGVQVVLLFTVAVHRRARELGVLILVALFGRTLIGLLRGDSYLVVARHEVEALVGIAFIVGCGQLVRLRRWYRRRQADRLKAEQEQRVNQIRRLERNRIAREMHDILAHRICLISMHADALEYRADAAGAEIALSASVIRSGAHQALQDLREVIGVLRADTGDEVRERPQPTLRDIQTLVEESQQAGATVILHFAIPAATDEITLSVCRTAYRIVQEGLTNTRKHAPGAPVRVDVDGGPSLGLNVQVSNPCPAGAVPVPALPGAGVGLIGLTERTELAGGRLEHGLTPEGEFRLRAWLPWPA